MKFILFILSINHVVLGLEKKFKETGQGWCNGAQYFSPSPNPDNSEHCGKACLDNGYDAFALWLHTNGNVYCYCEKAGFQKSYASNGEKKCGDGGNYGTGMEFDEEYEAYQAYCPEGQYHSSQTECTNCPNGKTAEGIHFWRGEESCTCPENTLSSNDIDCNRCAIGYVFNGQDECTKCIFPEISYKIAEKGDVCESAYDLKSTSATQSNLVLKFPVSPNIL